MNGWTVCIILAALVIFLLIRNFRKQRLDLSEKHQLETDIELLKQEKNILNNNIVDLNEKTDLAIERY